MGRSTFPNWTCLRRPVGFGFPVFLKPGTGLALVLALLTLTSASTARTWYVGHDVPTIRAGIDSARAGDDVLIPPGTYLEHDIRMKGGILLHTLQGPEASIVDARQHGRVFNCVDFEDEAVIKGLGMVNGRTLDSGAGVRCLRANLRIQDCRIEDCSTQDAGGGVYVEASRVRIDGCRFTNDQAARDDVGLGGGGIGCLRANVEIHECVITDCGAYNGGGVDGMGSGIPVKDCKGDKKTKALIACLEPNRRAEVEAVGSAIK